MEQKHSYKDLLGQKDFLKLVLANVINRFGDSIDAIAFEWMVYLLTGSAAWAALIFGVNKIPTIFLQPIAGAAIEKMNKKFVMIVTDLIRGVCVAFVALSYFNGFLQPWMLIVITLIISTAEAFRMPCSSAVVVRVLSKDVIDYGVSLNGSLGTIVEMIGLAVAAGIIAAFGVSVAIGIDAITFFGSALVILTMNTHEAQVHESVKRQSYIQLLKDGGKYAVSNSAIFNFLVLAVLCNAVFVPINSLQAPMVSEVLKSDAIMLSVFSITISGGMLLGTIFYPMLIKIFSDKKLIILVGVVLGSYHVILPYLGTAISSQMLKYAVVGVLSAIAGFIFSLLATYVGATFYKIVEEEYIARIASIMNSAGAAAVPLVSLLVSGATVRVSTSEVFKVTGIIIVIAMCGLAAVFKSNSRETSTDSIQENVSQEGETA